MKAVKKIDYFYSDNRNMFHLFIWWQSAILFAICAPSDITKTQKTTDRFNRIPTKEDVTNDVLAANTIQFIHRLLTNEDIKRKLDEFSMVKMRGYAPYGNSTPDLLALNTATVQPVDKMSNDLNGLQEFVNSAVPSVDVIQNAFNKRNNEIGFDYENGSKVENNSEATTHTLPYYIANQINKASNEKRDENCSILKYLIDRDILSMDRYQNLQYDTNFKENGFRGRAMRRYKDPHYVTKKYESYALSLEYEENDSSDSTIDKAKRKSWSDAISPSDKESYNDDTYYTEGNSYQNELYEVLKKQQDLVEKLALRVEEKKNIKRSEQDFEVLLEELAEKKEEEKRRTTTTTTPKPIRMLPTIRTMIDETEVRLALKNNPFVQRIIKMANRKKQKYFQNVKKHQIHVINEREPLRLPSDDTDN